MESNKIQRSSLAYITRRIFLNFLSKGFVGALLIYFVYLLIRFLIPPRKSSSEQDVIQIRRSEISVNKAKILNYKETLIIVINTGFGLFALSAVCTHLGCIVQWDENNQLITCPCHSAKYDLNGNVKSGPAPKPLSQVKVRMIDDKILIGEADL